MTCQSVSVRRIKRSFILSGIVWEASWFGRAFCSPFLLVFYTKRVREEVPTVLFNSIGMQRFYPVSVLGIEVRYIYVIVVISNEINICRIYFMDEFLFLLSFFSFLIRCRLLTMPDCIYRSRLKLRLSSVPWLQVLQCLFNVLCTQVIYLGY